MNILIVIGGLSGGGAETHVCELAKRLTARGHRVMIASSGGELSLTLSDLGVRHITLPLDKKAPWAVCSCIRRIKVLVRENEIEVLHAHTRIAAFICHAVAKSCGVPLVTTVHAKYDMGAPWGMLSRWGERSIAVGEDLKAHIIRHQNNILPDHICVIPNGIDTDTFAPLKKSNYKDEAMHIVFVSRLDADCSMAAYALCRIADKLDRRFEGVRITVCGGGSEYKKIKALAEAVNGRVGRELVRAVGGVRCVHQILQRADVFVGVSRAALEAMSCAVPVVLCGDEGFFGVLYANSTQKARQSNFCCRGEGQMSDEKLLSALSELLGKDSCERRRIGAELREYVAQRHSAAEMARRTELVYKDAVRTKKYKCSVAPSGGVLLCGYYGYGNMGDDALLMCSIERAERKYPDLPVCALTKGGISDEKKFCVRCAGRKNPLAVLRELLWARVVVFGGGTLLQSSTSVRSLWYYALLIRAAALMGNRVELWGNGIGRIEGKHSALACSRALCSCQYIGLRDARSLRLAKKLLTVGGGKPARLHLEEDLALRVRPQSEERVEYILSQLGIKKGQKYAVIAPRGRERRGYIKLIARMASRLMSRGIVPIYIPMYPREDLELVRRMCKNIGGAVAYPVGTGDVVGLMKQSSMVLAMRYHALVFAYSAGAPFAAFGCEPKLESFCRSHGGKTAAELFEH